MKMLSDYELFTQLCTKGGILAPTEVLEAMKIASSTGELRLPCLSIVIPVCEVIGRVLTSSSTIRSVNLSDCMLVSKGLGKILEALREGSNIMSLNLKGNNINGPIVSQLGDIFHHNNTLKHLYLEWNNLGLDTESFEKFCKGLCMNHNIEELDLRYNQITPYCAEALSTVLKRNKSLKIVNLSWNILGIQGGQLLFDGMKENSNIIKLNLRGNCISDQIIDAIEDCTYKNQSKRIISQTNMSKSIDAAKIIILHENQHEVQLTSSDDAIEALVTKRRVKRKSRLGGWIKCLTAAQEHHANSNSSDSNDSNSIMSLKVNGDHLIKNQSSNPVVPAESLINEQGIQVNDKISELNSILQDRTTAISLLTSEISVKDAEIEAAKSLTSQLQVEMNKLKDEHEELIAKRAKELADMKETQKANGDNWSMMYKELEEAHNAVVQKNKEWEAKARRYERDIHKSSLEIISLREKWMSKSQLYEDMIAKTKTEIHRVKRELKEKENRHKIELNVLKNTLKETTQALEECQAQLQKTRCELRETSTNLSNVKSTLREMEYVQTKNSKLEECLQKMKEEKSVIEEKFVDSQRTIASLKRHIATLQGEMIEPQRRYDLLKEELDQEQQKSARLKEELSEERLRIKEQDSQIQKMTQQITILNTQINDIQKTYTEEIREKDKEKKQLKEIITNKERDLNDLKAEEAQRAGQLYAAFSKYLSSIGPNTTL